MSYERRRGGDRRKSFRTPRFPFNDSHDTWVVRDRRVCPERRMGGIQVEWIHEKRERHLQSA